MTPANLSVAPDGAVLYVPLSGTRSNTILDRSAYRRLATVLRSAAADDKVHVVLLHGVAGCFCRGGDIAEFLDEPGHDGLERDVIDFFYALADFDKPLVAVVDGEATGVGCTILFHCDIVIASHGSTFGVPFVDFGLVPEAATSLLAPERIGYPKAFRFFCLGERIDASDACAMGLVSEVADESVIVAIATDFCRKLSRKPLASITATKRLLRGTPCRLHARIDREVTLFRKGLVEERTRKRLRRLASAIA